MTHRLVTVERRSCGDSTGTFSFCLPFPLPLTIQEREEPSGRVKVWWLEGKGSADGQGLEGRQK